MTQFTPPPLPQAKKPRGCLFYGAIVALVLFVLIGVGGFFAIRYGIDKIVEVVLAYTETEPMPLPPSTMSPEDYGKLERRVADFPAAMREATQPVKLVLSSDDLNALIANHPDWSYVEGKLHVTLDGSDVRGDVSLPLDDFVDNLPGFSRLKGRYLNGTATLKVVLVESILVVKLVALEAKGQSPSPEVMAELQRHNLVQDATHDRKIRELIDQLESIVVADGVLTITSKAKK
jgi:hypothetical protein